MYDLVNNSDASHIIAVDNTPDPEAWLSCYPSDRVSCRNIDATNETELSSLMLDVDVVVESLPGAFALPVGRLAAKIGVNLVSSMYYLDPGEQGAAKIQTLREELYKVDREAKEKGATILTEFGMDPGIDLVLSAQALSKIGGVEELYSYGDALPAIEAVNNPLKYKFSWSV